MLVTFLFWNIFKRPLQERVARIAAVHDVDVIILAECDITFPTMLAALNANAARPYVLPFSIGEKLRIFTRLSVPMIDVFNDPIGGLTIRHIRLSPPPDVLLAAVHLPSRVNWDRNDQTLEMPVLASELVRAENDIGTQRTILIGDFNMNPFDPGMVGAQALNAVMTTDLARREDRIVRGRSYRMFYNPMWGHFGDRTAGPPGTYYFRSSTPSSQFWNIYDQLLLRPALMDSLRALQILDSDGQMSLLTANGLPDAAHGSDHLPLLFQIDL